MKKHLIPIFCNQKSNELNHLLHFPMRDRRQILYVKCNSLVIRLEVILSDMILDRFENYLCWLKLIFRTISTDVIMSSFHKIASKSKQMDNLVTIKLFEICSVPCCYKIHSYSSCYNVSYSGWYGTVKICHNHVRFVTQVDNFHLHKCFNIGKKSLFFES